MARAGAGAPLRTVALVLGGALALAAVCYLVFILAYQVRPHSPGAARFTEATPAEGLPEADEAALLELRPAAPSLLRLAGQPGIFVLLFPDLAGQAAAMNRVAALVEKSGFPRDRLATPAELAAAISSRGDNANTWYLAHDYAAQSLQQFFALADRTSAPLTEAEAWLRQQLARMEALAGNQGFALLTLSGEPGNQDPAMRAAMLRHEVAHGWFFTRPAFATQVNTIWREHMNRTERTALLGFLAREGYDTANEELMANEAMAYLAFTPDRRLFRPESLGISAGRAAALRALYEAALR